MGRQKTYEAIVKGEPVPKPGVPESFKVMISELQGLGLDIRILDENNEEIDLKQDLEDEYEGAYAPSDSFEADYQTNEDELQGFGIVDEDGEEIVSESSEDDMADDDGDSDFFGDADDFSEDDE